MKEKETTAIGEQFAGTIASILPPGERPQTVLLGMVFGLGLARHFPEYAMALREELGYSLGQFEAAKELVEAVPIGGRDDRTR